MYESRTRFRKPVYELDVLLVSEFEKAGCRMRQSKVRRFEGSIHEM